MRDGNIITLYKNKGDRGDCNNYRDISLLSVDAAHAPASGGLLERLQVGVRRRDEGRAAAPLQDAAASGPTGPRAGRACTALAGAGLAVGGRAMAADRVGRRLGRASPARSAGLVPGAPRAERTPSPGIQRRQARVTVKYDRRELQRRLDTEKWIDGRLEELYRGRESEMPDEVNLDDLLEMATDGERAKKLQDLLESCHNDPEAFIKELLEKLRSLRTEHVLRRTSPTAQGPELQEQA
ncbi:protein phosphatase 1 regulatory subunit 14A [Tiliqua scincoides]|uniref:protein phosphatase 1 regulatory subunit 14A n=1 Tax=Tiliqua scincoides TaxID=71010 RepID=UPI003461F245